MVLVGNGNTIDNFITFIDARRYDVIGRIKFDGTDANSGPFSNGLQANGIEFCVFNPRDGKFYLNIPAVVSTNTQGYTLRISAAAPFKVEAAFQIPKTSGCTGGFGLCRAGPSTRARLWRPVGQLADHQRSIRRHGNSCRAWRSRRGLV